ncbi:MAG: PspC domain-containing protein [Micrococcales bacterium]|nr:PspC domain-containing protein [Micrococcales bacterium]
MPVTPAEPDDRPPLERARTGRRVAGVASGLAHHLGFPVRAVRVGFALGILAAGMGLLAYLFLWIFMPAAGNPARRPSLRPPKRRTMARVPWRRYVTGIVGGIAFLLVGAAVVGWRMGLDLRLTWWLPVFILLGGVVLAWSHLGTQSGQSRSWHSVLRLVGGLVLVTVGVVLLIGRGQTPTLLLVGMLAGLAVVAGVVVVIAPWWLRLWRDLGDERTARARESERADIAAHLHDSVLQTLAVIRQRADDPDLVRRLARSQERELRAWLYEDTAPAAESLAAGLREIVAEVEDAQGIEVGLVIVGDAKPDAAGEALLRAAREALINAARHGREPISAYLEASDRRVELFVRDHGDGFDLSDVPADRLGVRESIIGRVARQGGTAEVRRAPGQGTEVRLEVGSVRGGNHE